MTYIFIYRKNTPARFTGAKMMTFQLPPPCGFSRSHRMPSAPTDATKSSHNFNGCPKQKEQDKRLLIQIFSNETCLSGWLMLVGCGRCFEQKNV